MRPNILSRFRDEATPGLSHAAVRLHEVAERIGLLAVAATAAIEAQILQRIRAEHGNKGPVDNARNVLGDLLEHAAQMNYPIANAEFQKEFVNFVMSYVTEGFRDRDTTGTQMGYFQGAWRGGGF